MSQVQCKLALPNIRKRCHVCYSDKTCIMTSSLANACHTRQVAMTSLSHFLQVTVGIPLGKILTYNNLTHNVNLPFYCTTMYLPFETECYSVDDQKCYKQVKKLETFPAECWERSPRSRLISPETLVTGVRNDRLYDLCAADHVIFPLH